MNAPDDFALLAVRFSMAAVFLYSGVSKLLGWRAAIEEFSELSVPRPPLAVAVTIAVQIGGGLALTLGVWTPAATLGLAVFTVAATLIGHPFWRFEGPDFDRQLTITLEHLAIVGGLVLLGLVGPGDLALGRRHVAA